PIPVLGGLVVGLMARFGSERIRGHGIPEALEAILIGQSRMSAKVAILKPLSSAIAIGTGGPFGAEGPIIMTGGAFGSLFAQAFHLSPAERKTLLVSGAAGGMAAVFGTPVAAALLAIELLLFEWKPRSLIPVASAGAGRRLRHDPRPAHWTAGRRRAARAAADEGGDLGCGPGLGHIRGRACAAPHHGGLARRSRGPLDPGGRRRTVGRDQHGGNDGRHDALAVHSRRVRPGAHTRRQRARGTVRGLRRRPRGDRAPHEALDPHREGRAPWVPPDARIRREPAASPPGPGRDGASGAPGRGRAARHGVPR